MKYAINDWAINELEGSAFRVTGFTKDRAHIPDGWLIDNIGRAVNPKFCKRYNGATSVLPSPPETMEY